MCSSVYILGHGCFAEELANYITVLYPSVSVFYVTSDAEAETISFDDYTMRSKDTESSIGTYLGSGRCPIKARMANEVVGQLGNPIIMSSFVRTINIDRGCVIADAAVVGYKSHLGQSVLVNYGSSIGHHTIIGDLSVVSPHASIGGSCQIGKCVYVGAGAMIREGIVIHDNSTIGMGAIVTKDVPENTLVIGVNSTRKQPIPRKW